MTTFTAADRRRLEALKEKERTARQEEKAQRRKDDAVCKRLFGLTVAQVRERLDAGCDFDREAADALFAECVRANNERGE